MTEDIKKEDVEVPKKFESIVAEVEKLTVLELAELVKIFEAKFGVTAAAPVAAAQGALPAAGETSEAQEKSAYAVVLKEGGQAKIQVIKAIREITGLGLKESKDLVDKAPQKVKDNLAKNDAEEMRKKLEDAGATVELQ